MANPQITRIAIDTLTWTAITAPVDCNEITIRNDDATTKVRSDSTDPSTEDSFVATIEATFGDPHHTGSSGWVPRFRSGDTVVYVQAVSGTGPIIRTVVR